MSRGDTLEGDDRPGSSDGIVDRYEAVREQVRAMDPDAVDRQLPNLVATLADASADDEETLQFVVGVSFSQNDTLLDYSLDRLVDVDGLDRPRVETLKPAVSLDHRYLTFPYPPDPQFDAGSLRGALIVSIEEELTRLGGSPDWYESDEPDDGGHAWYVDIWKQFASSK